MLKFENILAGVGYRKWFARQVDGGGKVFILANWVNVDSASGTGWLLSETMLQIRAEKTPEASAIRSLILAAFAPRTNEADLVEALRQAGQATISLVAISDGQLAGHILFSPVTLTPVAPNLRGLGLAPLTVRPEFQRQGIGSKLALRGLEVCRGAEFDYVVVLGDPLYYSRFGFRSGRQLRLDNEYGADEAFMAVELHRGALAEAAGLVQYRPEFRANDC